MVAMRRVVLLVLGGCCVLQASAEPWRFMVAGDSRGSDNGVNTTILGEIADEALAWDVAFFLFTGDLVNGQTNQAALESQFLTWRDTLQPLYDAGIGVYPVRGNHDVGDPPGLTAWNNVFSGGYALPQNGPAGEVNITFSFEHENALIVGLDEYVLRHRVNQSWLDQQLDDNQRVHVFVFGHEAAFSVLHSDCLDDYASARNTFVDSIVDARGRTYFCAHDHFYDHAVADDDHKPSNDLHQFLAGTAGAPLYDWDGNYLGNNSPYTVTNAYHSRAYGYLLVEVDDITVTLRFMQRSGAGHYVPVEEWSYQPVWPCRGDLDRDYAVGLSDLAILLGHYGESDAGYYDGDLDGDGDVDLADLSLMLAYYGQSC